MKNKIGIIGANGFVGRAMQKLFPDAVLYDIALEGTTIDDINKCEATFLCVPTPLRGKTLDMSIVEDVVSKCTCPLIIIRSTLIPGTADSLARKYRRNIVVNPEYVGESVAHPLLDESKRPFLVLGGFPEDRKKAIEIYQRVYNANVTIRQVTNRQAELIKLSENRAIAFKIAECQELYDACVTAGEDYYTIRDAVYSDDPRFNLWWTFVYPEKRGFQSSCIPKDIYAWAAWAESLSNPYNPEITKAILERNEKWLKSN